MLILDVSQVGILELDESETRLRADLAPIIDGKTDLTKCTEIDLQKLDERLRLQTVVFNTSAQIYEQLEEYWKTKSTKFALLGQVIKLVQDYLESGNIIINPPMKGFHGSVINEAHSLSSCNIFR